MKIKEDNVQDKILFWTRINSLAPLVCAIVFAIATFIALPKILNTLDKVPEALELGNRVVVVLERTDKRVEDLQKTIAPLGKAAVEKSVEAVKSMDHKAIGEGLQKGTSEVGDSLKERAKRFLNKDKE